MSTYYVKQDLVPDSSNLLLLNNLVSVEPAFRASLQIVSLFWYRAWFLTMHLGGLILNQVYHRYMQ